MNLYETFWPARLFKSVGGVVVAEADEAPDTGTDARLDTFYCEMHGFLSPGQTLLFSGTEDYYCIECLRAWIPRAMKKVKRGLKPIE